MTQSPSPTIVTVVGDIRAAWSDRSHGDLRWRTDGHRGGEALRRFATEATGNPSGGRHLHCLRQVHGAEVLIIDETGGAAAGDDHRARPVPDGDGMVSASPSAGLAILTADCASIALGSEEGVFAAVHAGWRGLLGGVIEVATAAMRDLGATAVHGALGPTIHAECYEFSEDDLASVAARYGDGIRSVTSGGRPALDVPAAVAAAFDGASVCSVPGIDVCTCCSARYFSYRGGRDDGRQALVVWSMEESP